MFTRSRLFFMFAAGLLALGGGQAAHAAQRLSASTQWSATGVEPGGQITLAVVLNVDENWHINPDAAQVWTDGDHDPVPSELRVLDAPPGVVFEKAVYPQPHKIVFAGSNLMVYDGEVVLYLRAGVDKSVKPGQYTIPLAFHYQACDDSACDFPTSVKFDATLNVVAAGDGAVAAQNSAVFQGYNAPATTSAVAFAAFGWEFGVDPSSMLGLAALLLVAAVGGLLLNFTPCVLPVIPLKVMSLSQAAGDRVRCATLGAAMSLGVVAFWMALGLAIVFVTGFDTSSELFQRPAFAITVGVIIALMAVGMCGLFAIRLPRAVYMINPRHDTHTGSFGFGIMTAVLSTPCTAPFMGAAMAWAVTQSSTVALATFAAVGLGMAVPYMMLSAMPSLVRKMPRTGPGSELLKQVMGLLMLAAAAYFIGTGLTAWLTQAPDPPSLLYWWPVVGCVAAAGLWLAWRMWRIGRSTVTRVAWVAVGVVLLVASLGAGVELTAQGPIKWTYYTPERFERALAEGNIVMVDFTAEWCANCKFLEHTQLYDEQVVTLTEQPGIVAMKVDITGSNPPGRELLRETGSLTIPWLVIFDRTGEPIFKSDAYTAAQVARIITDARARAVADAQP